MDNQTLKNPERLQPLEPFAVAAERDLRQKEAARACFRARLLGQIHER